jgi:hypothetical protein
LSKPGAIDHSVLFAILPEAVIILKVINKVSQQKKTYLVFNQVFVLDSFIQQCGLKAVSLELDFYDATFTGSPAWIGLCASLEMDRVSFLPAAQLWNTAYKMNIFTRFSVCIIHNKI